MNIKQEKPKAIDAANFFIKLANDAGEEGMTNLRVNKLLYFAQAWSLARLGKELFAEDFQAWVYSEIREDCIVLLHDGVRPMIDEKTISDCIASVRQFGTAVTVAPATETVIEQDENAWIQKAYDRSKCMVARAPQCFYLKEILGLHEQSVRDGNHTFIDSTSMMLHYGHEVHTVTGAPVNIKVTTAEDFYICRALLSAREDSQLYGL